MLTGHTDDITHVAFQTLNAGGDGGAILASTADGDPMMVSNVLDFCSSAQQTMAWLIPLNVQIWDWKSAGLVAKVPLAGICHELSWNGGLLVSLCSKGRGRSASAELTIHHPQNYSPQRQFELSREAECCAVSPDGNFVAVGHGEIVWIQTKESLSADTVEDSAPIELSGHDNQIKSMSWGWDVVGKLQLVSGDVAGQVRVWTCSRGANGTMAECAHVLGGDDFEHPDEIRSLAVHGSRVVRSANSLCGLTDV
eukprot:SAG31_NODE_1024_length_10294_cov_7.215400_6_plen_253_part_00